MPAPQNFRNAFNGFHREDVVRYLEYINTKHTALVNQLTSEAQQLRELLDNQPSADSLEETVAALTQERDDLLAQVAALTARCEELEQQLTEPVETPPAPTGDVSQELEAYRRAERTERVARDRAARLYGRMDTALAEVTAQAETVSAQVVAAADQVMVQVSQLQTAVVTGKQALQEAAAQMQTIRPGDLEE